MPDHTEAILDVFRQAGALLEGHFLLSSGLHSPRYLQCALVLEDPARAQRLCSQLARAFEGDGVRTVIGPAIGGIVVAYELARALKARGIWYERQDGRMTLRRGFAIQPGERVLLVEDVVTTGGSLREVQQQVAAAGAHIVAVAALVDRTSGRDPGFGMPLASLVKVDAPTYSPEDCPLCRDGLPLVKPGSRSAAGKQG
jgi:orotate phosphoribosyltransferase